MSVAAGASRDGGRAPARVVGHNRPVEAAVRDQDEVRAQNSPSLRRDPRNPANLAIASRVDRPAPGCALHVSTDGGATWEVTPVPLPEAHAVGCFSPDVAFGFDGNLYLSFTSLAQEEGSAPKPAAVWIVSSQDHGRSLGVPVRAAGSLALEVRLVADPQTPGRLHLFWVQATEVSTWGFATAGHPIVGSRSDDGGATWRSPVRVSPASRSKVVAPSPAVGAGGELFVAYFDVRDDDLDYHGVHEGKGGPAFAGNWSLVVARSGDGGSTWTEADVDDHVVATQRFLVLFPPAPSLAVDRARGVVYVAIQDARAGDADVWLWSSSDRGRQWSRPRRVNDPGPGRDRAQYLPQVAVAPGGRLDVVYYDRGDDPGDMMNGVALSSSFDRGQHFVRRLRLADRQFDSHIGLGSERGMPDLGDRMGLVATDRRSLAVWADTRAGTAATGKQDLALAVADFPEAGATRRVLLVGGLVAGGLGLVLLIGSFVRRSKLAAGVVLLALIAGCGGGGGGGTIPKADYLKQGKVICANGNASIAAAARQPRAGADANAVATFVRVFVPGIRDQISKLRALGYPKGDKATLDAIFDDAESILRRAEQDPSTIDGHAFDDVNRRLTAYGLTVCGS